jgi:hypothetical protein
MSSQTSGAAIHPQTGVRSTVPPTPDSDSTAIEAEKPKEKKAKVQLNPQKWNWPSYLAWVPGQLNWQGLKPVIRCSIASWIVALFRMSLIYSHLYCCFVRRLRISLDKLLFFTL